MRYFATLLVISLNNLGRKVGMKRLDVSKAIKVGKECSLFVLVKSYWALEIFTEKTPVGLPT